MPPVYSRSVQISKKVLWYTTEALQNATPGMDGRGKPWASRKLSSGNSTIFVSVRVMPSKRAGEMLPTVLQRRSTDKSSRRAFEVRLLPRRPARAEKWSA